jgi:hypothetical protein
MELERSGEGGDSLMESPLWFPAPVYSRRRSAIAGTSWRSKHIGIETGNELNAWNTQFVQVSIMRQKEIDP